MNKNQTTYELLLGKYKERYVQLEKIKEYTGIENDDWLKTQAARGKLEFKTFKLVNSKKAPYFVDLQELADLMDRRAILSREKTSVRIKT